MRTETIVIASDFTDSPGARFRSDGPNSGEEFREVHLEPHFAKGQQPPDKLVVILDGVFGYATSFLEEAFGGLARKIGSDLCAKTIKIVSLEDPALVPEIESYIRDASEE